jgi:hypothetical protein
VASALLKLGDRHRRPLRPRRERRSHRAAEPRDEIPPPHPRSSQLIRAAYIELVGVGNRIAGGVTEIRGPQPSVAAGCVGSSTNRHCAGCHAPIIAMRRDLEEPRTLRGAQGSFSGLALVPWPPSPNRVQRSPISGVRALDQPTPTTQFDEITNVWHGSLAPMSRPTSRTEAQRVETGPPNVPRSRRHRRTKYGRACARC